MTDVQLKSALASSLRALRLHSRLPLRVLSDLCEVTPQAVSRWENGSAEPSYAALIKLCDFYNVTLDSLHTLTQEQIDRLPTVSPLKRLHDMEEESQNV